VIGIAFLAGTLYRSTKEGGGGSLGGGPDGLAPDGWAPPKFASSAVYFQAPRDYQLNVKSNGTLDIYVLDSVGIRLWKDEGKLAPATSLEGITPQTATFHLNTRGDCMLLVHNPSKEVATVYELSMSGYGIETDLLYASLGLISLGAVVTIVGFIPKGNRGQKHSAVTKSVEVSTAAVALLILLVPIASCTAQSTSLLAPNWMKEGTYVTYNLLYGTHYSNGVLDTSADVNLLNGTYVNHKNVTSITLRWECIKLTGDKATLNVTYTLTSDLPSENFYASAIVDVDTASRSVHLQNGTLIGTTKLWLPSHPADGQEVVLWDMPPDKVTANVVTTSSNGDNIWISETPQGTQTAFQLVNLAGTLDGEDFHLGESYIITGPSKVAEFTSVGRGTYEDDTGLMLDGDLEVDPISTALGMYINNIHNVISTNVDMGPALTVIDWSFWLSLAAVAGTIAAIAVVMVVKRRRKR
jgi:hypothetical protein